MNKGTGDWILSSDSKDKKKRKGMCEAEARQTTITIWLSSSFAKFKCKVAKVQSPFLRKIPSIQQLPLFKTLQEESDL